MKWFYLLIVFSFSFTLSSQEFYFKNIGTEQGLPSSETYQVLQDSKGYIWILTDAGICRYDGKTITTYTTLDGISENVVLKAYEDKQGRIWFNTLSGYFFYFENGKFTAISANSWLKKTCTPHPISSFYIGEKDTLFCATTSLYGIIKISPEENYKNVVVQKMPFCNRFIVSNKLKYTETIMGGTGDLFGIDYIFSAYCNYEMFYIASKGIGEGATNTLKGKIDKDHNIYLPNNNLLAVIRAVDKSIEYHVFPQTILSIYQDYNSDLWIGTAKGGYLYKKSDLKSKPVHFLSSYLISGFLLDREGSLWISTIEKGVFQANNKNIYCYNLDNDKVSNFQKKSNKLYISTYLKNEITIDSNNILIEKQKIKFIPDYNFQSKIYKGENYSYYGTDKGLIYYENGKTIAVKTKDKRQISPKKIIEINKDTFLIFSPGYIYFLNKEKVFKIIKPKIVFNTVTQLKNKNILFGSRTNDGLFELKNDIFSPILNQYPQLKTRINNITEDSKGNLWIATNEKGLFYYYKNKLFAFTETNGLASNKVNKITFDKPGNIWAATNKGLSKIIIFENTNQKIIYNFNKSHGLPGLEIDNLIEFNGKLWCSAKEYLFYFNSDLLSVNNIPSLCYINSILVNNKSVYASNPIFNYDQNNIEFTFDGITYKNPEQKEYFYKLAGYDKDWKYSNTGIVQYTNLKYGNYNFQVSALNNDKLKNTVPANFNFSIQKPYWLSWWFIFLEFTALIFFIFFITKWWGNRIRKREQEKASINQKLAEFQMTAIRAQMNPHFVFNAISSIQHYILKNDIYQSYNYLAKFSMLIRNVLDNSKEEYILLSNEINTLNLYIDLEKIRFKEAFEAIIHIDDDLEIEDTYIPTMLIQPYIENAIWHGLMPKQKNCTLLIDFKKNNEFLEITVQDNGVGRSNANNSNNNKKHVSKGMALIKQRLSSLEIKNEKIFSVIITDLMDQNERAAGTKVSITIPLIYD